MKRFTHSVSGRLAAAAVLLAATPSGVLAAGAGGQPSLFDVNLGLSVWTIVIFLSLVFILRKYAWGPMLGALESRERRIQDALDASAAKQAEAARLLEEHKAQLADARRQAQEIVSEGKEAGEKVRREIEEKARDEATQIVERARREIEREKDRALAEIRNESVDLALAAASKLMQERMDREKDRELVEDFLDDMTASGRAGEAGDAGGARA